MTTGKPTCRPAFCEQVQPRVFHPLERVGRGARLERAAAQQGCAGRLDRRRRGLDLRLALDRARPGNHRDTPAADFDPADVDARALGADLARGELEAAQHGHHAVDSGDGLQMPELMLLAALLANAGHHRALDAADDVGAIVELLDHPDHGLNLRLGGAGLHYNDHSSAQSSVGDATLERKARKQSGSRES